MALKWKCYAGSDAAIGAKKLIEKMPFLKFIRVRYYRKGKAKRTGIEVERRSLNDFKKEHELLQWELVLLKKKYQKLIDKKFEKYDIMELRKVSDELINGKQKSIVHLMTNDYEIKFKDNEAKIFGYGMELVLNEVHRLK